MNSTLKMAVPIILVVVVVFGATMISQYTSAPEKKKGGEEEAAAAGEPLVWPGPLAVSYDPQSEHVSLRAFPGFFEKTGEEKERVSFWFDNPHPQPVKLGVLGRSCTSCTSARLGVVKPAAAQAFFAQAALGSFPPTPFPAPDLFTPLAAAALIQSIEWQQLDFDHLENKADVPPAADDKTPTVGVFQMEIKVKEEGQKTLYAGVGVSVGNAPPKQYTFGVSFVGVPPFEVMPKMVPLGQFPEVASARPFDLYCWSATRTLADFPPPAISVGGDDPFLQVAKPVPLNATELAQIANTLSKEGRPMRVVSGYKVPATVYRHRTDVPPGTPTEPDVGPFERTIDFAGPNGSTQRVIVTATVTGLITLDGGEKLDMGSFSAKFDSTKTFTIRAERPDLELEPIPQENVPSVLKVDLSPPRTDGGRSWTLKLTVPAGFAGELPANSAVVFRAKTGGKATKVRIAVVGRGRL